jgi:hypothetical protein
MTFDESVKDEMEILRDVNMAELANYIRECKNKYFFQYECANLHSYIHECTENEGGIKDAEADIDRS